MARIPTQARRTHRDDDDDGETRSERTRITLSGELLARAQVPRIGRPPKDEDEKREVFTALAFLKSARRTNKECATELDVSERTVATYVNDPLYLQIQQDLQSEAKQQGHTTIAAMIPEALERLYYLLHHAKSEFVSYKSAEKILDAAGYNLPREEARKDNHQEVEQFFAKLREREQQQALPNPIQVNVQVTTGGSEPPSVQVVEGALEEVPEPVEGVEKRAIPAALRKYYEPVQPGGRLPGVQPPKP